MQRVQKREAQNSSHPPYVQLHQRRCRWVRWWASKLLLLGVLAEKERARSYTPGLLSRVSTTHRIASVLHIHQ